MYLTTSQDQERKLSSRIEKVLPYSFSPIMVNAVYFFLNFSSYICMVLFMHTDKLELPPNYQDQSWDKLRLCVQAVFDQKPISYMFEELYHTVENMCSHGLATVLYHNLETECKLHIESVVRTFQKYPMSLLFFYPLCMSCVFRVVSVWVEQMHPPLRK